MIADLIYEVLFDLGIEIKKGEEQLISDLIEDSFTFMMFIVEVEERLNIQFSDEFLAEIDVTLNGLIAAISNVAGNVGKNTGDRNHIELL